MIVRSIACASRPLPWAGHPGLVSCAILVYVRSLRLPSNASCLSGGRFVVGRRITRAISMKETLLAARAASNNPRRISFAKISEPLEVPQLLSLQTDSFDWLIGNERWQAWVEEQQSLGNDVSTKSGLQEIFEEISPIEDSARTMPLAFENPLFYEPKCPVEECKEKDFTYSAPVYVSAEFTSNDTGEIKGQTVFMGGFPLM